MATNRETLKGFFKAGDIPLEAHFGQLIDNALNQKDDNIWKDSADTPLNIRAVVKLPSPTGQGGDPTHKLMQFYKAGESKVSWQIHLANKINPQDTAVSINGLNVTDEKGQSMLFIDKSTGYVGLYNQEPKQGLHVNRGNILLTNLANVDKVSSLHFRTDNYGDAYISNENNWVNNGTNNNRHLLFLSQENLYLLANKSLAISSQENTYLQTTLVGIDGKEERVTRMSITKDGNVGIGSTNPVFPLVVTRIEDGFEQGVLQVGSLFSAQVSGTSGGVAVFGSNIRGKRLKDAAGNAQSQLQIVGDHNNYGYAGMSCQWGAIDFHCYRRKTTAGEQIAGEESLRMSITPKIKADGSVDYYYLNIKDKVGIGVTTPTDELEVKGTIKATESYKFSDNSEQKTAVVFKMGTVGAPAQNPLASGTGDRYFDTAISYAGAFAKAPNIHLAISHLDVDQGKNARVSLSAQNVTKDGFTLRVRTSSDTIIYGVTATWLALGN